MAANSRVAKWIWCALLVLTLQYDRLCQVSPIRAANSGQDSIKVGGF